MQQNREVLYCNSVTEKGYKIQNFLKFSLHYKRNYISSVMRDFVFGLLTLLNSGTKGDEIFRKEGDTNYRVR